MHPHKKLSVEARFEKLGIVATLMENEDHDMELQLTGPRELVNESFVVRIGRDVGDTLLRPLYVCTVLMTPVAMITKAVSCVFETNKGGVLYCLPARQLRDALCGSGIKLTCKRPGDR
jgi:hypothetical protein